MRKLLLLLALFMAYSASQAQVKKTITVDGKSREFILYQPNDCPQKCPLVISLHGFNQSAQYQMENTQWNNLADTAKIIVVYPQYSGGFWDTNGTSDTKFIEGIIKYCSNPKTYGIDVNRVYVSGFSLGAMMTYRCVEELSDKVAAFAPVSGVRFDNKKPVAKRFAPILHTHGTGDDVFKWGGDPGHASGGYPYIPDYVESWAKYEGMDETPEIVEPYPAERVDSKDKLTRWKKRGSRIEVALLQLDGVGHWHSDAQAWGGISTTQEIWRFCKRYSLLPEIAMAEPEDMSFDLPLTQRTFVCSFDVLVDATKVKAQLAGNGQTIDLNLAETANSSVLTFSVPEDVQLIEGDYKLNIIDLYNSNGAAADPIILSYTYGFTEVGDDISENPSPAEIYKGGFLRKMQEAITIYDATENIRASLRTKRKKLKECIDKYTGFASTAPSEYIAAMEELESFMGILRNYVLSGVDNTFSGSEPVAVQCFTMDGRKASESDKGIAVVRKMFGNGDVEICKRVKK